MTVWLAAVVAAAGVVLCAALLAYIALPLAVSDRIAVGLAVGTAVDGLLAAAITVYAPDISKRARILNAGRTRPRDQQGVTTAEHDEQKPDVPAAVRNQGRPGTTARPARLALADLRRLADLLLDVREIRSPAQWQLFLDELPGEVTQSTPRQATGRMEVIALLRTCEDHPGAWSRLDAAVWLMTPDSSAARAFSEDLQRLHLLDEGDTGNGLATADATSHFPPASSA